MIPRLSPLAFVASLALSLCAAGAAHAQTVISSLPYTISTAGAYVLNSNLSSTQTSGTLILISASNVTLDFQNHYITGSSDPTSTTTGVFAGGRNNVSVINGTVSHVQYGISFLGGVSGSTPDDINNRVENMRVNSCYQTGISLQTALAARILSCQVSQIGLSSSSSQPTGIYVQGASNLVQGCVISNIGKGNTMSYAISLDTGSFARQNNISSASVGVAGGFYQDNLVHGCATPFSGGVNAGGNFSDNQSGG